MVRNTVRALEEGLKTCQTTIQQLTQDLAEAKKKGETTDSLKTELAEAKQTLGQLSSQLEALNKSKGGDDPPKSTPTPDSPIHQRRESDSNDNGVAKRVKAEHNRRAEDKPPQNQPPNGVEWI